MKKFLGFIVLVTAITFQFCSSSRNARSKPVEPPKITYNGHIAQVMSGKCQPCHFPPKGNKTPYDTYASVKGDIDDIISRIQRNPGDPGFMPLKHPKLPDSTIQLFVQWKADGLLEK
jgi:hypothetical protein